MLTPGPPAAPGPPTAPRPSPAIAPPPRVVLHDRWEQLPQQERTAFLARRTGAGRWPYGASDGWQRGRPWQPMRPLVLDRAEYDAFGLVAQQLLRLTVDACRRRATTVGELQAALRDPRPHRLLEPARPLAETPLLRIARPDVLLSGGVPQFMELNIAITLYGMPALDRMAQAYARLCPDGLLAAPPHTHRARSALLAEAAGAGAGRRPCVLVPTWRSRSGPAARLSSRRALRAYLQPTVDAAAESGLDAVVADLSRLRTDAAGNLYAGESRIDLVLNWFISSRVVHDGGGLAAIATALAAGTVQLFFPEAMRLLSSKQALAWLHEDLDLLAPADRATVEAHVPWTGWTAAHQGAAQRERFMERALDERRDLVLKPAIGANGSGVVFGSDVDGRRWRRLLTERAARRSLVVQRRVEGDTVAMPFLAPESGRRCEVRLPFVLAPFLVDGRICGSLVRHFGPEHPSGAKVINSRKGAVANTVLLR
ncbi:hypothetical protein [Kitasatospora sp. NPDC050543]|uniref:hypothetical protein n=1 Tax=Kitasatospora sp. NPDC050543 TaxID=3364054 RepID=UPI00378845DA